MVRIISSEVAPPLSLFPDFFDREESLLPFGKIQRSKFSMKKTRRIVPGHSSFFPRGPLP